MGWGDETRTLTQDIITSHELRKEDLKQMQEDTCAFLTQAGSELKEMSARLKVDLAKVKPTIAREEAERIGQAGADLKQRQAEVKDMINQVAKLLSDLNAAHEDMSISLKADLTKIKPELAQAEVERVRQTGDELREMVAQIHAILEKVRPDLSQAESERARQTEAELKEMSTRLKADLARVKLTLAKEETDRVKQAQIMIKERVTAVDELLGEVKAERGKAAAAWLELVNVMRAEPKPGMAAPPVAEPAKEEAMAKAEPGEMATAETEANGAPDEEEAIAEGKSVEKSPETTALNDQVLAYLADHLDGTRMTELEEKFGVARIQMARLLKELMDKNKAEKRDMLYFAI